MTKYPVYIVDAFATKPFLGNQAAVCLINRKVSDEQYQKVASEFNLSETVYPLPLDAADFAKASRFSLRWFTPTNEVPLCGHATLATAHVLLNELGNANPAVTFETLSGPLVVKRAGDASLGMDFPLFDVHTIKSIIRQYGDVFEKTEDVDGAAVAVADILVKGNWLHLAIAPAGKKLIIVIDPSTSREDYLKIEARPDELLRAHPSGAFVKGAIVTFAPSNPAAQDFLDADGKPFDYVSRYFAPWNGISEDPATGSSQCALAAFWSKALKNTGAMKAFQCYPGRGAEFIVTPQPGGRLEIVGQAVTVVEGHIRL